MNYIMGDTVKLRAEFHDWEGNPADPTHIKLSIMIANRKPLYDPIDINESHRVAPGVYEYPFIIPTIESSQARIYFSFSGTLDDFPVVCTDSFMVNFSIHN